MMQAGAKGNVTLFLGAPTRVGQALNDMVREESGSFEAAGLVAVRNVVATHALRDAIGDNADAGSLSEIFEKAEGRDLYLSAMYGLGRPATAFKSGRLFPEAERMLRGISAVLEASVDHVVLAIEPLHWLFRSIQRAKLDERVRGARWEDLYEASWIDVVASAQTNFPDVRITVLTPSAFSTGPVHVLHHLFGSAGFESAGTRAGETLVSRAAGDASEARRLACDLGLDGVTCDLLETRFRDDCERLLRLDNVRVF